MLKYQKISIAGCGWLGIPLGNFLSEKGYEVKGSTTKTMKFPVLIQHNIMPFLIEFSPEMTGEKTASFLDSDILIISLPPAVQRQGTDFHPQQIESLLGKAQDCGIKRIIYISSTSVYPELNKEVDETLKLEESLGEEVNQTILRAEKLLLDFSDRIPVTILRCGGLMGYDRMPGKYFAGKKGLLTGDIPVNFIHRDDVVSIISEIIYQEKWNEIFNLVAPIHPIRKDIYLKNAEEFNLEAPTFTEVDDLKYKIISSKKMAEALNYDFKYPNPLYFRYI